MSQLSRHTGILRDHLGPLALRIALHLLIIDLGIRLTIEIIRVIFCGIASIGLERNRQDSKDQARESELRSFTRLLTRTSTFKRRYGDGIL